jgi:hypothetical protein
MNIKDVYIHIYVCYWTISEELSLNISDIDCFFRLEYFKTWLNFKLMLLASKKIEFMIKNRSLFQFEQNYDYSFNFHMINLNVVIANNKTVL